MVTREVLFPRARISMKSELAMDTRHPMTPHHVSWFKLVNIPEKIMRVKEDINLL